MKEKERIIFMNITIREFLPEDLPAMTAIWNQVVEEGNAFPQENPMTLKEAGDFFQLPVIYRCGGGRRLRGGTLYSPSQQCRPLRPFIKRQLCCFPENAGTSFRRTAGLSLSGKGRLLRTLECFNLMR